MHSEHQTLLLLGRFSLAVTMGFICGMLGLIAYSGVILGILLFFGLDRLLLTPPTLALVVMYGLFIGLVSAELMLRLEQYLLDDRSAARYWRLSGLIGGGLAAVITTPIAVGFVVGPLLGVGLGLRWQQAQKRQDDDRMRTKAFTAFLQQRQESDRLS